MGKLNLPPVGLAEILRRNGLRQIDVARAVGVTREAVRLWSRGLKRPRVETAMALVEWLRKVDRRVTLRDIVGPAEGGGR